MNLAVAGAAVERQAAPVLWRDPGPIASRDVFWGAASADRQPVPPFRFVKEDTSGSKPKLQVIDARGTTWRVKLGGPEPGKNEVHPEVAASRLMWALGYLVEEHYYVASGRIEGIKDLDRASAAINADGSFRVARFERRAPNVERSGRTWTLDDNPFAGSKELSGLKLMTALVNNWDNKHFNTAVDVVTLPDGRVEEHYLFSDLGASFGRMAGPPWTTSPTRWKVDDYRAQPLVKGVEGDSVRLHFEGQVPMESVPLAHAQWFVSLASQLTQDQVRAAFKAAGASEAEVEGFSARFLEKVRELQSAIEISRR
jgi:hypothetical protein